MSCFVGHPVANIVYLRSYWLIYYDDNHNDDSNDNDKIYIPCKINNYNFSIC